MGPWPGGRSQRRPRDGRTICEPEGYVGALEPAPAPSTQGLSDSSAKEFLVRAGSRRVVVALCSLLAVAAAPTAAVADGPVHALTMTSDRSRLYLGGTFATVGGLNRTDVAALATTGVGSVDPAFNPGADGDVDSFSLSADGTRLYLMAFASCRHQTGRCERIVCTDDPVCHLPHPRVRHVNIQRMID